MKRLLSLAIILLTSLNVLAQQKTVNIVTVNNPDMITLKKLSTKFEEANPNIKLNWLVLEENIMRQRITTDVSTGSQDWVSIPEVASVAFAEAVAAAFCCTGFGLTLGSSVGAVASYLTVTASDPTLPASSVQDFVIVTVAASGPL